MGKRKNSRKKMPRGNKKLKKDKIHGLKKGTKGEAATYITRAQALAKLQVSLADFRRLCILKGIYPRDPKKKSAGKDKTYYHKKDIAFLSHEPVLAKFMEFHAFMKKFKRLMGRREESLAAGLEKRKPKYTLHHLVRERYPCFEDALRDLDDALSMLALFQALSGDQKRDIPPEVISEAATLYQEFQLYCIRAQALRKVFVSIKGYYFQADVAGQTVTWLAPHQFAQELPPEVDFRVMLTFVEFYRAMVKFVNFKLFSDLGLSYPPKRLQELDAASGETAALEVEMKEAGKARQEEARQGEKADAEVAAAVAEDFGDQTEEAKEMQQQLASAKRMRTVFHGLRVFVGREVPLRPLYFILLSGGVSEVGWERGATDEGSVAAGSAFAIGDARITHQLVDRPPDHLDMQPGREYIQPQWVFDSFNLGCQLPIAPYAPGKALPPHLSPFVDDKAEGYVPRQREILDKFAAEASGAAPAAGGGSSAANGTDNAVSAANSQPQDGFVKYNEELRAESTGQWHSEFQEKQKEGAAAGLEAALAADDGKATEETEPAATIPEAELELKPVPKPTEEEEENLRARAIMPRKHKELLKRIERTAQIKKDANSRLFKKRKMLDVVK